MKILFIFFILTLVKGALQAEFLEEREFQEIVITGPLSSRHSEISGLTWFEDWLILLPQYPTIFGSDGEGAIFYLERHEIKAFLTNQIPELTPQPIRFTANTNYTNVAGFEGFEAIAFHKNTAYLVIESSPERMLGFLGKARLDKEHKTMLFDSENLVSIEPQANIPNACYETIFIHDDKVFLFYEANGKNVNSSPQAHVFDLELQFLELFSFPNIEYRITDATQPHDNVVWMINYFWPGERSTYKPADDTIKELFGYGKTHQRYEHVERLLAFTWKNQSFQLMDREPLYLELEEAPRNWEGIVRFEDGFIIATDRHPRTILAYVKGK